MTIARRLLTLSALLLSFVSVARSEQVKTIGNPWTGKPDYITALTSGTIPAGATNYIWNTSTLQNNSTFYVTSGTVRGPFTVNPPSDQSQPAISILDLNGKVSGGFFTNGFGIIQSTSTTYGVDHIQTFQDDGTQVGSSYLRVKRNSPASAYALSSGILFTDTDRPDIVTGGIRIRSNSFSSYTHDLELLAPGFFSGPVAVYRCPWTGGNDFYTLGGFSSDPAALRIPAQINRGNGGLSFPSIFKIEPISWGGGATVIADEAATIKVSSAPFMIFDNAGIGLIRNPYTAYFGAGDTASTNLVLRTVGDQSKSFKIDRSSTVVMTYFGGDGNLVINQSSPTIPSLVIQSTTGQTSNLTSWQVGAITPVYVNSSGIMNFVSTDSVATNQSYMQPDADNVSFVGISNSLFFHKLRNNGSTYGDFRMVVSTGNYGTTGGSSMIRMRPSNTDEGSIYFNINYPTGPQFGLTKDAWYVGAGLPVSLANNSSTFFTSLKSSAATTYNQTYVLPDSTGSVNSALSIKQIYSDHVDTYWQTISAGSGDMILASTQTSTGAKTWNSYSTFVGSATFQSTVTFSGVSTTTYGSGTALDMTSAVLVLPVSAAPSTNGAGQIGLDTTDNVMVMSTGPVTPLVFGDPMVQFTATISTDSTGVWQGRNVPIWQNKSNMDVAIDTITATTYSVAASTLAFQLQSRPYNALNTTGTNIFTSTQPATWTGFTSTSFSSATIRSNNYLVFFSTTTSPDTGTVNNVIVSVRGHKIAR